MANQIPQWRVTDRIGRVETYEDPGRAFLRACELAHGDHAVSIDTPNGPMFAVIQRDLKHSIHIVTRV